MPITKLHFTNVGPFEDIEFEFDKQVNVFTGPNNSGKSTALIILGDIAVYPFAFPRKLLRPGEAIWEVVFSGGHQRMSRSGTLPIGISEVRDFMAHIGYSTFVPAQRQSTDFRSQGPTIEARDEIDEEPDEELKRRKFLFSTNAMMMTDEAIVQKVVELDYRSYRRGEPAARQLVGTVAEIAGEITEGFPIEFNGIGEDTAGYFPQFQTADGVVPLNVLSQGTQSIIQWLAHLLIGYAEYYDYPSDLEDKPGILIIDEIDAHLHPSWQRRIIPTLTKHFPNLQIFCSTHSPLMLAGLKEGQVQLLRRDENGKVVVSKNETDIIGWSADEIMRNYLGVASPTDMATAAHVERLQVLRMKGALSAEETEELERLRHQVNQDLLGGPKAAQAERFASALKQAKQQPLPEAKPIAQTKPKASRNRRSTNR